MVAFLNFSSEVCEIFGFLFFFGLEDGGFLWGFVVVFGFLVVGL